MRFPQNLSLQDIASICDGEVRGDGDVLAVGISPIYATREDHVTFLDDSVFYNKFVEGANAAAIICGNEKLGNICNIIYVSEVRIALNKLLNFLAKASRYKQYDLGIAKTAVIADSASLGDDLYIGENAIICQGVKVGNNCYIGHGTIIEDGSVIGDGVRLEANVTINSGVDIGKGTYILSGAVIGSDGFGFAESKDGKWTPIPQLGGVKVGKNVSIGSSTTVDRGTFSDTRIGDGVKIDNHVQIAHNVIIDDDTIIAGFTGIAGSALIGKRCKIGGGCGLVGHIIICDDVILCAGSNVSNDIRKPGIYGFAFNAEAVGDWKRTHNRIKKLDVYVKKLLKLERVFLGSKNRNK